MDNPPKLTALSLAAPGGATRRWGARHFPHCPTRRGRRRRPFAGAREIPGGVRSDAAAAVLVPAASIFRAVRNGAQPGPDRSRRSDVALCELGRLVRATAATVSRGVHDSAIVEPGLKLHLRAPSARVCRPR